MNLFKISETFLAQLDELETTQDLDLINELEITKDSLDNKVIAYDGVIKDLKGKEQLLSDQIKRLQGFKKTLKTKQDTLKRALMQVVLLFGEDRKMTKAQREKGLSRAGKTLDILNENGAVKLIEVIKQKPVYDPLAISAEDNVYTIEVSGESLKKLNSSEYIVIKQEQKPSAEKVAYYEETSHLMIK
jgi:hypothetical protein